MTKNLFLAGVLVAVASLSLGCGGGGTGAKTTGSLAVCEANCDDSVALACPRTPANWAASCKMLCAASRSAHPDCTAVIDAVSACVADKVTFICQDGLHTVTPVGACRAEGQACLACTGDLLGCSG